MSSLDKVRLGCDENPMCPFYEMIWKRMLICDKNHYEVDSESIRWLSNEVASSMAISTLRRLRK